MSLTSILCALLGGHEWQGPRIVEGRVRLVCGLGCGAMTAGIETRGQELARRPANLIQWRDQHQSVWEKVA